MNLIRKMCSEITLLKLQPYHPGANELNFSWNDAKFHQPYKYMSPVR